MTTEKKKRCLALMSPLPPLKSTYLQRFQNSSFLRSGKDLAVQGFSDGHEDPLLADGVAANAYQCSGVTRLQQNMVKNKSTI